MCKPFRGLSGVNDDEEFSFDYKKNIKNYQSLVLKRAKCDNSGLSKRAKSQESLVSKRAKREKSLVSKGAKREESLV